MADTQLVDARGVTKSYGSVNVLNGVDFDLGPGQVTCIFGPSGSGKTTFLRCLNQLETIDGGSIRIDGELIGLREERDHLVRLRAKQIARQRAKVGMVFQHFNLFPHRTVLENLIEAPVHVQKKSKSDATEIALVMLDRVGLASKRNQYPAQLSGGQKQRVAIARALTMTPKLMLFDEPTSALDPELVGEVLGTMQELARDGMAMIVVTHEIGFGREVADNAVFFDDGRILAAGPPKDVLDDSTNPRIAKFLAKVL